MMFSAMVDDISASIDDTYRELEPATMAHPPHRPVHVGPWRAFESVARHLHFGAAAEELHLTQPAVSRQIQGLEEEVGAPLFLRGSRKVTLTAAGAALLRTVGPFLDQLDATVRQVRQARGRPMVSVTTFVSFASLWLIPRLEAYQREHPDVDIRVLASDTFADPDGSELDLALRYCRVDAAPAGAVRLFGEHLAPVVSRLYLAQCRQGELPPLEQPADLRGHALMEEDDALSASDHELGWRPWLARHGLRDLAPRRWLYFNYTHQQVQAALAGQGVALARLPLVADALARGELVLPFAASTPGAASRPSARAYWLIAPAALRDRPEVAQFCKWVEAEAHATRVAIGEGR